ncbi:MAG: MoaD/ThiS family protein [Planctomycetota bacterium]|jgi:molybdopterin converting factor small subunit
MRVRLPGVLDDYTGGTREIDVRASSLAGVFAALERRWPGVRFRVIDEHDRVRKHMTVYVNDERAADLTHSVASGDTVLIVAALSGG